MKDKTYRAWVGQRVARKDDHRPGMRGTVNGPGGLNRWWRVLWDDGRLTLEPERNLTGVSDERKPG